MSNRQILLTAAACFALLMTIMWFIVRAGAATLEAQAGALLAIRLLLFAAGAALSVYAFRKGGPSVLGAVGGALAAAFGAQVALPILAGPILISRTPLPWLLLIQCSTIAAALIILLVLMKVRRESIATATVLPLIILPAIVGAVIGGIVSGAATNMFEPNMDFSPVGRVAGISALNFVMLVLVGSRAGLLRLPFTGVHISFFILGLNGSAFAVQRLFFPSATPESETLFSLLMDCAALGLLLCSTVTGLQYRPEAALIPEPDDSNAEAARRDALTGLFNRRTLDNVAPGLFSGAHQLEQPISLLIMDIDHFKRVNDTYGHPAGDEVLKQFARIIASQFRVTDLVVRYGGEEFVAILPGAPLAPAMRLGEKIRAAIQETEFDIGEGKILHITSSIGVATAFPGEMHSFGDLFSTADKNLYRAKNSGRNRVMATPLITESDEE